MEDKSPYKRYDVHITNGQVTGRFKFSLNQKIFNWIISLVITALGGHGVWSHNHQSYLESALADNQKKIAECEVREVRSAALLQQLGYLLEQQPMKTPTSLVGIRDASMPQK